MPKKVLIALPPGLLEQVDFIAQSEHRNRSELIREALRRYLDNFKRTQGVQLQPMNMERPQMTNTPAPRQQPVQSAPVPSAVVPQAPQPVQTPQPAPVAPSPITTSTLYE